MKLQDLTEAESPARTLGNQLFSMMKSMKAELESEQTDDSTHSIGGNFMAHRSGKVEIRAPYAEHSQYGSINWSAALCVGNNVPDALEKCKQFYGTLVDAAKAAGAEVTNNFGPTVHFKLDGGNISLNYDYARSFCTVKLRIS